MSKFRSLFKYKIPKYRIISRTTGGRTRYIIQRRKWFGWRAVTNLRTYGVGNPTIEVIAEYDRQIDAEKRVLKEIDKDIKRQVVTKVVKVYYIDDMTNKQTQIINE